MFNFKHEIYKDDLLELDSILESVLFKSLTHAVAENLFVKMKQKLAQMGLEEIKFNIVPDFETGQINITAQNKIDSLALYGLMKMIEEVKNDI